MSYIEENLLPAEKILYRAHMHWVIFSPACLVLVIGLLFLFPASAISRATGGFIILAGIAMAIARWTTYQSSEFAVTDRRVLIKTGFIRRHSLELVLQRVEGIGVDQGLMGRLLGYGTIVVTGTGGTKEAFQTISHPLEFRRQVQQRVTAP